jgi:Rrf2 family transcriptional regulator, iron-sulfur cluster assembly transcription factor
MELVLKRQTHLALLAFDVLRTESARVSRTDLAHRIGTTDSYLPQVLRPLIEAGWVGSQRGPDGGYELLSDDVTLLEVVEAVEGPLGGRCVLSGGPCPGDEACPFHAIWSRIQEGLRDQLGDHPLATTRTELT